MLIINLFLVLSLILIHYSHRSMGIQQALFLTLNTYYASLAMFTVDSVKDSTLLPVIIVLNYIKDFLGDSELDYKEKATLNLASSHLSINYALQKLVNIKANNVKVMIFCLNIVVLLAFTSGMIIDKNEGKIFINLLKNAPLAIKSSYVRKQIISRIFPHYVTNAIFAILALKPDDMEWNSETAKLPRNALIIYVIMSVTWYLYDKFRMNETNRALFDKIYSNYSKEELPDSMSYIDKLKYIQNNKRQINFDQLDRDGLKAYKDYIFYLYRTDDERNYSEKQFSIQAETVSYLSTTGKTIFGLEDNISEKRGDKTYISGEVGKFITAISPASSVEDLIEYIQNNPGNFIRYYNNLSGQIGYTIFRTTKDTDSLGGLIKTAGASVAIVGLNAAVFKLGSILYKMKKSRNSSNNSSNKNILSKINPFKKLKK